MRLARIVAAAVCAAAVAAPAAEAASVVYVRDANVWVARADGSGARALTSDGTKAAPYMSPSEDDQGVVVVQRGSAFVRMDQAGRVLGTIASLATGAPAGSSGAGPFSPRVSPDGTLIAYGMGYVSGTYDPGCSCTLTSDEEDVVYTRTDGSGPVGTSRFFRSPSWADDRHVIVAAPGNRQTAQVGIADVTALGDGRQTGGWLSDDGANVGGYVVDLDQPDLSRTLDRLALVRGMAAERLALYRVAGDGLASLRCELMAPSGWYSRPAWAPDGHTLTYADNQGVWSVVVPDDWATSCDLKPTLLVPGASDAGWSAAALTAPAAPAPSPAPSNGGPAASAGPPNAPAQVVLLRARAGSRRGGLSISVRTSAPAAVTVTVLRCRGARCRPVATLRRAAGSVQPLVLHRRLAPGRYRVVAVTTGGAAATQTVRVR